MLRTLWYDGSVMPPPFGDKFWDPADAVDIRDMVYMGPGPRGVTGRLWDDYQDRRAHAGIPRVFTPNTMSGVSEPLRAGFFRDPNTLTEWYAKPWPIPEYGVLGSFFDPSIGVGQTPNVPTSNMTRAAMASAMQDQFFFDYARRIGAYAPEARQIRYPVSNVGAATWPGIMTQRYSPITGHPRFIERELGFAPNMLQYPENQLAGLYLLASAADLHGENTPATRIVKSSIKDFGGRRQLLAPVLSDPTVAMFRTWEGRRDEPYATDWTKQERFTPEYMRRRADTFDSSRGLAPWAPAGMDPVQVREDLIKKALQLPTNITEPEIASMTSRYLGGDTRRTFMDRWRQYGDVYSKMYPAVLPLLLGAAGALMPQRAEAAIGRGVSAAERAVGGPQCTASIVMNALWCTFDTPLGAIVNAGMGAPPLGSTQILRYPNAPADRAANWAVSRVLDTAFPPPPPTGRPAYSVYGAPQWSASRATR